MMTIIMFFHALSLQRENAKLRLMNSVHELGLSLLPGALRSFGQRPDSERGSGGVVIE
jgi:hypothetical protein